MSSQNPFILSADNKLHKNVIKRKKSEKLFKAYGMSSIVISILFLSVLFYSIFSKGASAFLQTKVLIEISLQKEFSEQKAKSPELKDSEILNKINYRSLVLKSLKNKFPEVTRRADIIQLYGLVARNAYIAAKAEVLDSYTGRNIVEDYEIWLPASSQVDMAFKGKISREGGQISDIKWGYIDSLEEKGHLSKFFNKWLFTQGDSREPESAGILGAVTGSIFVILICMLFAIPLGLGAAIYLEEFAPKNKLITAVELAISNLAAVPSIVFGLLGLALLLNFGGLQRSSALAGGLTLGMLVLPIIVVAARNAIATVPPSIKQAAIGLGASKMQVVFHHILPLALPGIMTGAILSIARALGETAPLLMIGMVAFVRDIPQTFLDPSTVLPVQIYIWSDLPEMGFQEKTSAAIIILLLFLVFANSLAVYLRKKFEYKW